LVSIPNKPSKALSIAAFSVFLVITILLVSCSGGTAPKGWSGAALRNDTLYLGSRDGRLIAVKASSGSREWATPLETGTQATGLGCSRSPIVVTMYGTPAVSDSQVYMGGYNGRVYSFVPGDNQPDRTLDRVRVGDKDVPIGPIVGSVVLSGGNLFFGDGNGRVYALTDRLQPIWSEPFKTGRKIESTPTVHEGVVYVGSFDKKLYALNASDGTKKWDFATQGVIYTTPVIDGATIYVGSFDRSLYALDAVSGQLKWSFEGRNGFWATPVVHDGVIYAPNLDGRVYILRAGDGQKITEVNLGARISSSPVLVGNDLIVATQESRGTGNERSGAAVFAIDTATNASRQLARLPGERVLAPLAASQGSVYVHTDRDSLNGIDVSTGAVRPFAIK
jgi:eukaryotic-like serine/threonine-protein kinase